VSSSAPDAISEGWEISQNLHALLAVPESITSQVARRSAFLSPGYISECGDIFARLLLGFTVAELLPLSVCPVKGLVSELGIFWQCRVGVGRNSGLLSDSVPAAGQFQIKFGRHSSAWYFGGVSIAPP
jgi:hypothetical protein